MDDYPSELHFFMARGDLFYIPFGIYIDEELNMDSIDQIFFTVKKHYYNAQPVFQKTLENGIDSDGEGNYLITILPEDTENLEFGEYDFDIEIIRAPDIKKTFVGVLMLTKEVTHRQNEGAGV